MAWHASAKKGWATRSWMGGEGLGAWGGGRGGGWADLAQMMSIGQPILMSTKSTSMCSSSRLAHRRVVSV